VHILVAGATGYAEPVVMGPEHRVQGLLGRVA
jgi:hypothetical protein